MPMLVGSHFVTHQHTISNSGKPEHSKEKMLKRWSAGGIRLSVWFHSGRSRGGVAERAVKSINLKSRWGSLPVVSIFWQGNRKIWRFQIVREGNHKFNPQLWSKTKTMIYTKDNDWQARFIYSSYFPAQLLRDLPLPAQEFLVVVQRLLLRLQDLAADRLEF